MSRPPRSRRRPRRRRPIHAPIRVAVVGRPNSGKSTLINRLIGEERMLTGPEAGITRDAIAVDFNWRGTRFRLYDTAGMRRRSRIDDKLEKLSVADALAAIRFADVVVMLMDAERPFEEQDLRIADLVEREGRALVLAMNKWDLVKRPGEAGKLREQADHWLPQVKGVPIVAVSGLTGNGLDRLVQAIIDAYVVWNRRVPTNPLNRWLAHATTDHPPPAVADAASGSPTSRSRRRGRRASSCSAPAPMRCPTPIGATSSTGCATRSISPARRSASRCGRRATRMPRVKRRVGKGGSHMRPRTRHDASRAHAGCGF